MLTPRSAATAPAPIPADATASASAPRRPKIPDEAEALRSALVRRLDALIETREAKRLRINGKSPSWTWTLTAIGAQP